MASPLEHADVHPNEPVRSTAAPANACVKARLLAEGLRLTFDVAASPIKPPTRVRSGSCGGLDLVLPDGSYVNGPVHETFAKRSPLALHRADGGYVLSDELQGWAVPVSVPPEPAYYGRTTADGVPMQRVGQLCSDRLGIGLTNVCTYWRSRSTRCKFCSIGLNVRSEQSHKPLDQILEVADAAFSDPVAKAHHVLLGGGTPEGPDAGAAAIAEVARALKERWAHSIYAMLAPPRELSWLDELHASGVDEVGINIELWDPAAAAYYIPGKQDRIGRDGYLRALARAVALFGPIHTRSIMVVGLESAESTLAGVQELASMGVMPILSPFRPLVGTELEHHPRLSAGELCELTARAAAIADRCGMPLGPTCLACQSNTLTPAAHAAYRRY